MTLTQTQALRLAFAPSNGDLILALSPSYRDRRTVRGLVSLGLVHDAPDAHGRWVLTPAGEAARAEVV